MGETATLAPMGGTATLSPMGGTATLSPMGETAAISHIVVLVPHLLYIELRITSMSTTIFAVTIVPHGTNNKKTE